MTGGATTSRFLRLPATPDSVAAARRFVRSCLRDWSMDELDVDATTVASELVTNAVLHAGVGLACAMRRLPDGVRLEVHDGAAGELLLPATTSRPRPSLLDVLDDLETVESLLSEATTGRGLQVVGELSADWGVDMRPGGKVVWALICREAPEAPTSPHLSSTGSAPAPEGRPVRLVAVPVRLALQSDLQLGALVREFQVMGLTDASHEGPAHLVSAAREILEDYSRPRSAIRRSARDAVSRGDRLFDVTLVVPDGTTGAWRRLQHLLQQVDVYCRGGQLLALAATDELQAFRSWYADEIERQLAGEPPAACPFPVEPFDRAEAAPDGTLDAAAVEELARLSAVLSRASSAEQIAREVLAEAVRALGADRASVCLVAADRQHVDIVESIGYVGPVADHWSRFPLAADLPASETIRTGRALVLRTLSERNSRYPVFASTPALEDPSFLCVPLGTTAPARGALVLNFARSRDFNARDLELVRAFCDVTADAFARVAAQAERAHREQLARVRDQVLHGRTATGVADVLTEVATTLSREVFDYCMTFALQAGAAVLIAAEHRDPGRAALAHGLHSRWPPRLGSGTVGRCLSSGEIVVQQVVPPDVLPNVAETTDQLQLLRRLDITSTAVVPIVDTAGSVVGAVSVANQAGRYITDGEIEFLRALGESVGREIGTQRG